MSEAKKMLLIAGLWLVVSNAGRAAQTKWGDNDAFIGGVFSVAGVFVGVMAVVTAAMLP